jgi:meso-butanediol dehydrogenase / (S,S)-butanediol dehydrogenase / diacetyl reductase
MMRFDGKRVLITGGGTGISAATATRMIEEGAVVTVMGRRQAPLESISPHFVVGDVSKSDDCRRAVEVAGPLDILVHNAGVAGTGWDDAIAVNLTAAHHLCEFAERDLVASRGAIVTVGSTAAMVSGPIDADYNAAKAGLVMLTRSLAVRLGPHGVRANAVCPGWVRTPMGEEDMRKLSDDVDDAYRKVTRFAPLRRAGEPEEIASAICYLASDDASYITGAIMMADGGSTAVDVLMVDYEQG